MTWWWSRHSLLNHTIHTSYHILFFLSNLHANETKLSIIKADIQNKINILVCKLPFPTVIFSPMTVQLWILKCLSCFVLVEPSHHLSSKKYKISSSSNSYYYQIWYYVCTNITYVVYFNHKIKQWNFRSLYYYSHKHHKELGCQVTYPKDTVYISPVTSFNSVSRPCICLYTKQSPLTSLIAISRLRRYFNILINIHSLCSYQFPDLADMCIY